MKLEMNVYPKFFKKFSNQIDKYFVFILLFISLFESCIATQLISNSISSFSFSQQIQYFASSLLFWLLLLCFVSLTRAISKASSVLIIGNIVRSLSILILYGCFSLWLAGLAFIKITGYSPDVQLFNFLASNILQVLFHVVQTSLVGVILGAVILIPLTQAFYIYAPKYELGSLQLSQRGWLVALFIFCTSTIVIFGYSHQQKKNAFYVPPILSPVTSIAVTGFQSQSDRPKAGSVFIPKELLRPRKTNNQGNWTSRQKKVPKSPVVAVLVESLRHDLFKSEYNVIPFLKNLAEESLQFNYAYTPATHSNYADPAIWSSTYPLKSLLFQKELTYPGVRSSPYTVFSAFHELGYKTAYISSQNEKWGNMIKCFDVPEIDHFWHSEDYHGNTWVNQDDLYGLVKLIESKVATAGKVEDSQTLDYAKKWVMNNHSDEIPFFLGLNLQNTHYPYVFPENGEQPFGPCELDFPTIYGSWPQSKKELVLARYRNAVWNVDKLLEDFVSFLKSEGIWNQCYFIVMSDSGEAFYEHGFANHSGPAHDEQARCLAIMKTPGNKHTGHISSPISLIDIFPELLHLIGHQSPPEFQGLPVSRSLLEPRNVYIHSDVFVKQYTLVQWPYKLMYTVRPYVLTELFNLELDPKEANNLAMEHKEIAQKLFSELLVWIDGQIGYHTEKKYYENYYPPRWP